MSVPWKYITTSIGCDMPGATTILDNKDDEGNGEVGYTRFILSLSLSRCHGLSLQTV